MKTIIRVIVFLMLSSNIAQSQSDLAVLKSNTSVLDISDNGKLHKGYWSLAPEVQPDIFITNVKDGRVVFYSDIDSIVIIATEHKPFDFNVVLNDSIVALTRVEYRPTHLATLKASKGFNNEIIKEIPKFSYQDSNNKNLEAFKMQYNLDSIAGGDTETARILNLLRWVHRTIPHDGQHNNPSEMNGASLLKVCALEDRGLNCRGLATVLNEAYLSLGIPSRIVTCLPKDPADTECHVINTVYHKDLNKWIYIDPTHEAYVLDENGEFLSIQEVRDRLVDGRPMILNPEANWNYKVSTLKETYLYDYMAKNLYRFESPINSEYNLETNFGQNTLKYVQLNPIDHWDTSTQVETLKFKTGAEKIIYKTNNPNQFWSLPLSL